ncbi:hypothetical protein AB6A40_010835 [Gnathostoma spinigerum]|uniref:BESS domain-containing protein n=1 Tax=Gnathostoma spinigerum TaxID=75299 RepID=A0ABD6EW57_9BILA
MLAAASPCSSTSSEIDVGTASSFAAQQQSSQQQAQQIPQPQQQNMILLTPVSQHAKPTPPQAVFSKTDPQPRIGQPITTADGSIVTVTARGTAPLTSIVKKDVSIRTNDGGTVTMIIDPTTFYQHGSQKMYRLVNVSELNPDLLPSASGGNASTNEVKVIGIPPRRKRVAAGSVQGMSNGRGQLGDDLILDDGIGEKTVTIDPALIAASPPPIANDRVLLDHHSNVQSSSSGMVLSQHNVQQVHHQQQLGSAQQQHHQGVMGSLRHQQQQTQGRFVAQQVAVQQPQYTVLATQPVQSQFEQELIFANSIATHLSRLNEDEKAVAKMNIQRILMDARFGMGACARMINDEELSEAAANSSAHDIVTSQQQIAATPPRR